MKLNIVFFVCLFFTLGCSAQTKDNGTCPTVINKFLELDGLLLQTQDDLRLTNDCTIATFARDIKREGNHKEGLVAVAKLEKIKASRIRMIMNLLDIRSKVVKDVTGLDPRTGLMVNPAEEAKLEILMIGVGKEGLGWKLQKDLQNFTQEVTGIADADRRELPQLAEGNHRNPLYRGDKIRYNMNFVQANFGQTPAAAALAIITHKQNEVLRTESTAIRKIIDDLRNSPTKK